MKQRNETNERLNQTINERKNERRQMRENVAGYNYQLRMFQGPSLAGRRERF